MKIDKFVKEKFIFNNSNNPFRYVYYFFNKFFSKFHYNKSFSQGSMDLIIQHIYKDKNDGVYIDVGCQHPVKNNNTYLLFKKGWSGINIDLDKVNIDLFNYYRPTDLNINVALSDKIEEVDLFYYHQKSPINTLDKKISDKQKVKVEKIIKVKTNTLTNILQSTQTKDIDVLSIDVEGYELKVLKGLNFNKYIPKIIIVEFLDIDATKWEIPFNNIDKVINSEIYSFLISKNYKFINWVNGDLVFINKNI